MNLKVDLKSEHKAEVERLINECENSIMQILNIPVSLKLSVSSAQNALSESKPLFREWAKKAFSDCLPKTRAELYRLYKNDNGNNAVPETTFSSKLSLLLKENYRVLGKQEFKDYPMDKRYYYGLYEWFDGDMLMEDFLKKIKSPEFEYQG